MKRDNSSICVAACHFGQDMSLSISCRGAVKSIMSISVTRDHLFTLFALWDLWESNRRVFPADQFFAARFPSYLLDYTRAGWAPARKVYGFPSEGRWEAMQKSYNVTQTKFPKGRVTSVSNATVVSSTPLIISSRFRPTHTISTGLLTRLFKFRRRWLLVVQCPDSDCAG